MQIKVLSSLEKVFPQIEPTLVIDKASMLKNERFNLQVALFNDMWSITECKIKVSGDIAKNCALRMVDLVSAQLPHYGSRDDYYIYDDGAVRLYPDILRPFEYGDMILRSKQWQSVWCTIYNPDGLTPGEHTLKFTVIAGEQKATAKVTIKVIDAVLPESDLYYTNWMHYDGIAQYYKVKPWTSKFYKLFGTFLDSAVKHGMNILYTPIFTPALDTKIGWERMDVQLLKVEKTAEGEYKFDFSELDKFVDFALSHGIKYFEMSHLTTQWGALACPKIMAKTEKGYKRIFGWDTPSLGDEYKKFLSTLLPLLDKYLKEKGIADKTFFHISDEPSEAQFEHFSKVASFIKPFLKDYDIMDATSTPSNEFVDIPILSTTHIPEDASGKVWAYYCCSACADYLSNRFINMPSQRNRILGIQLYERNINGFLQWAFNFYNTVYSLRPLDPFAVTDAGGAFPSGDSFVSYPGTKGCWDSLRLEVFYDGLQDRMALKLLEKSLGREAVVKLINDEGVKGWRDYPRSAQWHIAFREKINALIEENN